MLRLSLMILAGLMMIIAPVTGQVTEGDDAPLRVGRFMHNGKAYFGHLSVGGLHQLDGHYLDENTRVTGKVFALDKIKILAPVQNRRAIFSKTEPGKSGKTGLLKFQLREHVEFLAPDDEIAALPGGQKYRFAPQLVIMVGEKTCQVNEKQAGDAIAGVSIGNVLIGRNETSGKPIVVLGPWLVPGLSNNRLQMQVKINGRKKTRFLRNYLPIPVEKIVARVSRTIALEPGDVIFTGTRFFKAGLGAGDTVEIVLEGVGVLRNRVSD